MVMIFVFRFRAEPTDRLAIQSYATQGVLILCMLVVVVATDNMGAHPLRNWFNNPTVVGVRESHNRRMVETHPFLYFML